MTWDDCIDLCASHNDKIHQIESAEKAELYKNFILKECPAEDVWMGYLTRKGIHYWLDENLEPSTPVPQDHIDGLKSIGCNYFDEKFSDAVPFITIKNGSVNCKDTSNYFPRLFFHQN